MLNKRDLVHAQKELRKVLVANLLVTCCSSALFTEQQRMRGFCIIFRPIHCYKYHY
jgi:hypothetical protein